MTPPIIPYNSVQDFVADLVGKSGTDLRSRIRDGEAAIGLHVAAAPTLAEVRGSPVIMELVLYVRSLYDQLKAENQAAERSKS